MTISGVASGSSIRLFAARLDRRRQRVRPSAIATPSGVATSVVRSASHRVLDRARRRLGSPTTEPESPTYHRNEKPCQVLRERPALKENWIATSTGTSDHRT